MACRYTHGSWYSPLIRSRYCGWCICQHSTTLSRGSAVMLLLLTEHLRRDEHYAAWSDVETLRVLFRVLADDRAGRQLATLIDHGMTDPAFALDDDVRQDDGIRHRGMRIDAHIGEEQRVTH